MRHNPVSKSQCPFMMAFLLALNIVTQSILKVTQYPSFHNCPTERSEFFAIPGKIYANVAGLLSSGMSRISMCVESMVLPFVSLTLNGCMELIFLWYVALIIKICPVHTESTITLSLWFSRGGLRHSSNFFYFFRCLPNQSFLIFLGIFHIVFLG